MLRITKTLGCLVTLTALAASALADHVYAPAVRELPERRTANARHFLCADGSYRAEVHLQPIHYQAADGSWQPIDTALATANKAGFALANETNSLKTYLPASAGGWARVEAGNTAVSFQPLGAQNGSASVQGNAVQFAGVGTNVGLSYTVEPGQLKELITLTAPGTPPTFRYAVRLEGLTARKNRDNSIALADGVGNATLLITAPWMKDAAGKCSGAINVDLAPSGDGFIYTMAPDPRWLASARYPVTIDPTISAQWTAVNLYDGTSYYADSFWTPGISGDGSDTGPYLAVGIDTNYSTAYRSVLSFNVTGVPADSEIQSATLSLMADHATTDANLQVQVYGVNKVLSPSGLSTQYPTPNNIGLTADDLKKYPSVIAPLEPNFWGAYKTFNVADLVQNWADDRTTALNFMIRDTKEDLDPMNRYPAIVYFYAANSTLTFDYTTPGWYMLQGNRRHTGRTQTPIASNPTQRWATTLGQVYTYGTPDITPGLIAVPPPGNPGSAYPIVYAVTSDGLNWSTVYRLQDNGTTVTVASRRILPGVIHSTPLLHNGVLWVAGTDALAGFMYALNPSDVSQLAWANDATHPNPMRFRRQVGTTTYQGVVYSSPVPNPATNGVIVSANVQAEDGYGMNGSGFDLFLFCKDSTNGLDQWITPALTDYDVYSDPPEGGTQMPNIFSSPAVTTQQAYVATTHAWVNSVDLATGNDPTRTWAQTLSADDMDCRGSVMLYSGRVFGTFQDDDRVGGPSPGGAASLLERPDHSAADPFWSYELSSTGDPYADHWALTTPALRAERNATSGSGSVIFGDDTGTLFGVGTEVQIGYGYPETTWTNSYQTPTQLFVRSSPVVAGAPGGVGYAYVVPEDGYLYVLNADTGAYVTRVGPRFNALVHSNMAAYKGRLYAITVAGTVACFQ